MKPLAILPTPAGAAARPSFLRDLWRGATFLSLSGGIMSAGMELSIVDGTLRLELTPLERLAAFRPDKVLEVPLGNVASVDTEKPKRRCSLRWPGTHVPGMIRAGTYISRGAREFWYAGRRSGYLVLNLQNERYDRIVVTVRENERWRQEIDQRLGNV